MDVREYRKAVEKVLELITNFNMYEGFYRFSKILKNKNFDWG